MTNTQITLIQIDNYGPWTVTPSPRPEPDLQALQARLYADFAEQFGHYGGYVFWTRFDNVLAVTNGCVLDDQIRIQESIGNRYPISVSMSTAVSPNPTAAIATATDQLQATGSAQDADRCEVLTGETLSDAAQQPDDVQIAHFDINDVTGQCTDRFHAYDAWLRIREAFDELMHYMHETHDAATFFIGGDNGITVCPHLDPVAYQDAIDHVGREIGTEFKVGVGSGRTAVDAGLAAKHALEECRHKQTTVEQRSPAVQSD